ncbi:MAG: hypothetical protein PHS82_03225 [Lachnospiraceae bacterium]|nr:hypothetical protein [Lachnospiraceae bacterium]
MFILIFKIVLLVAACLFLLGTIGEKDHKEKNLYFTIAFVLLVLLLVALWLLK